MSFELGMADYFDNLISNNYSNFYDLSVENLNTCNISSININPLYSCYHFICKVCDEIPKIVSFKKDKIKLVCSCQSSPKEIEIKKIFEYLIESDNENKIPKPFRCNIHTNEKNIFYCRKCGQNYCHKCINDCIENKHEIQFLKYDIQTIKTINYICKKIKDKNSNYFGGSKNISFFSENNQNDIIDNNNSNNNNIIENNINSNKGFQNNTNNSHNSFEIKNDDSIDEDYYFNLFSIIINDFNNFPNSNNISNISLIENYINYYQDKHKEIKLKYQIKKDKINKNSFELFGQIFVNNNKDNFFLVINGNLIDLKRFINLEEIYEDKNLEDKNPFILEVKLLEKINRKSTDLSFMFFDIQTLHYLSDFSEFDMTHVENMSYIFYNCKSITSSPDISKWDTSNVKNMSYMFYNCELLKSLPDISKWNTSRVKNMSYMFYNCGSLKSFPDISKWNTSNVKNMDYIFYNCKSLTSLPEISQWKIKYINNMSYIYYNSKVLSSLLQNIKHKNELIIARNLNLEKNEKKHQKKLADTEKNKNILYDRIETKRIENELEVKMRELGDYHEQKIKELDNERIKIEKEACIKEMYLKKEIHDSLLVHKSITTEMNQKYEINKKKLDMEQNIMNNILKEKLQEDEQNYNLQMLNSKNKKEEKMVEAYYKHKENLENIKNEHKLTILQIENEFKILEMKQKQLENMVINPNMNQIIQNMINFNQVAINNNPQKEIFPLPFPIPNNNSYFSNQHEIKPKIPLNITIGMDNRLTGTVPPQNEMNIFKK